MMSLVFLPISAATLAIAAVGGESATVPAFPDLADASPSPAAVKTCHSNYTQAAASLDVGVWRPDDVKTSPMFLWAVDRRIDGCEVIVPVGNQGGEVPLPVFPEPGTAGDLLHRANDAPALLQP